jgi:phosphinothricin acetyltransferase
MIRKAIDKDVPGILEIYNDAILNTTAVYTYDPHSLGLMEQWFRDKQEKGLPVFVAEMENKIAGFASYGPFRPWPAYKHTVEHSIYVHKDFRGQGISKVLLTALIEEAKAQKLHTIVAGIDSENAVSISLHEKLGFHEVGLISQVGFKFDRWLDLKFMQLILEEPKTEETKTNK